MKKKIFAAFMAMAVLSFPGFGQAAETGQTSEETGTRSLNRGERKSTGVTIVITEPDQRASSVRAKQETEAAAAEQEKTREEVQKERELKREQQRLEREKKKAERAAAREKKAAEKALARENRRRAREGLPPLTPEDLLPPAEKARKMHEPQGNPLIPADWGGDTIYGLAIATEEQCVKFLLERNPQPQLSVTPAELVHYYFVEGAREGIRGDVAFAQAMKETGYFGYGGTVVPDQNNYCGLGTTSRTVQGGYFPSAEIGVRAHIQHLLAYSSTRRPNLEIVDPRYELVREIWGENCLTTWTALNGHWAVPGDYYGESILEMFEEILAC